VHSRLAPRARDEEDAMSERIGLHESEIADLDRTATST